MLAPGTAASAIEDHTGSSSRSRSISSLETAAPRCGSGWKP
ncbi:hypothetical protein I553_0415 [Mycobacterium xenopi 4042]|uniref:Uncharacterized protein n=1 Tax=Mycobacterium xenopi 4042 TaxID=1299334 RepID=X7YK13_MYCXE|nr:hypothetical protein I553_0415 [Mycobacterium xenopi 4042]